MHSTMLIRSFLVGILLLQVAVWDCDGAPSHKDKEKEREKMVKTITKKLKASTPAQIKKYKVDAAKRMQVDLARALNNMAKDDSVPPHVQQDVRAALQEIKAGKFTDALAQSMPNILQKAPPMPGKPADQLANIIGQAMPYAPQEVKNPLQGPLNFLQGNLNGLNTALMRVAGGTPDLMQGTLRSLTSTLGAVQEGLGGSVGSLGQLLGGLLATVN